MTDCEATFETILKKFSTYNKEHIKGQMPNSESLLIKCPKNCYGTETKVKGLTIHDVDSPICLSAIADRAIDHTGGIISVVMTKSQNGWNTEFTNVNGI